MQKKNGPKNYFLCYLERHAKIKNRRQIPSGRKVCGRKKKKERKKKNNAKFSGHDVRPRTHNECAHALHLHQCMKHMK